MVRVAFRGKDTMKKTNNLIRLLSLTFFLLGPIILFYPHSPSVFAMPQDKIETIILRREPNGISPKTLKVKLGTTIVWFNAGQEPVTVNFIDKLGVACKAPVNFHSDLFGHYETSIIERGGTASICFIFKGEYSYEVKRLIPNQQGNPTEELSTGNIIAVE